MDEEYDEAGIFSKFHIWSLDTKVIKKEKKNVRRFFKKIVLLVEQEKENLLNLMKKNTLYKNIIIKDLVV